MDNIAFVFSYVDEKGYLHMKVIDSSHANVEYLTEILRSYFNKIELEKYTNSGARRKTLSLAQEDIDATRRNDLRPQSNQKLVKGDDDILEDLIDVIDAAGIKGLGKNSPLDLIIVPNDGINNIDTEINAEGYLPYHVVLRRALRNRECRIEYSSDVFNSDIESTMADFKHFICLSLKDPQECGHQQGSIPSAREVFNSISVNNPDILYIEFVNTEKTIDKLNSVDQDNTKPVYNVEDSKDRKKEMRDKQIGNFMSGVYNGLKKGTVNEIVPVKGADNLPNTTLKKPISQKDKGATPYPILRKAIVEQENQGVDSTAEGSYTSPYSIKVEKIVKNNSDNRRESIPIDTSSRLSKSRGSIFPGAKASCKIRGEEHRREMEATEGAGRQSFNEVGDSRYNSETDYQSQGRDFD